MATFKICVRKQRKDLLYPIYIRYLQNIDEDISFSKYARKYVLTNGGIVEVRNL